MNKKRQQYSDYLRSPAWLERKKKRLSQAGWRCEWVLGERCSRKTNLCVHHVSYERLGQELSTDLEVYCWFHHMAAHLLWFRCSNCQTPLLEEHDVEKWLLIVLHTLQIDLDRLPHWTKLPTKEYLACYLPELCRFCWATLPYAESLQ